ncbi:MAG: hypothetical protein HQK50_17715 [Oligoflexia bacterium]|nr:hypothetical protein [Oligoflexia bacterium]MBF0367417.1 hypothetical protein [Oligoflexia bacterium]
MDDLESIPIHRAGQHLIEAQKLTATTESYDGEAPTVEEGQRARSWKKRFSHSSYSLYVQRAWKINAFQPS